MEAGLDTLLRTATDEEGLMQVRDERWAPVRSVDACAALATAISSRTEETDGVKG